MAPLRRLHGIADHARGLILAGAAAGLFGAAAPASKILLGFFSPAQLAGLLYLGAAAAMLPAVRSERRQHGGVPIDRANRVRLAAVVMLGGALAPLLLLVALQQAPAAAVALLLNFEIVATAVLGAALFHDHLPGGAWLGIAGIVAAGTLLSGELGRPGVVAALLVVAACTGWGVDNHCSALIDGMTPARSTLWKGAIAGTINLSLGALASPIRAPAVAVAAALAVGAVSYGASIALHTAAAQRIGAVRAQAVFAAAPFIGAALSMLVLGEVMTPLQLFAGGLFLLSVAALMASRHEHLHRHGAMEHVHAHLHDDGHHAHEHADALKTAHTHWHRHEPVAHAHPHWPDLHHRHSH